VPEVSIRPSIAGEQNDAVGFELVEGVLNLAEDEFGVFQRRKRGERTQTLGVLVAQTGAMVVDAACHFCTLLGFLDADYTRRGERENAALDADRAAELLRARAAERGRFDVAGRVRLVRLVHTESRLQI
jgi:hypothetical protein